MSTGKTYSTKYLLDSNNNRGSEGQVLISTSTGVDWKDASSSSIIGGPYLPLSAGSTKSLSGDLYLDNGVGINFDSGNVTLTESGTGDFTINAADDIRLDAAGGDVVFRADAVEYSRISKTSNGVGITSSATNSDILINPNGTGNVGIGTTSPGAKLHVDGDQYENFVVQSTANGYAPASAILQAGNSISRGSGVYMHNTINDKIWYTGTLYNDNTQAWNICYDGDASAISGGRTAIAQSTYSLLTVKSDGNVGIGTTSPDGKLEVSSNSSLSSYVTQYTNDADGAELVLRTARGTEAAPVRYNTNDSAGRILFKAYTSSNQFEDSASIESVMESGYANAYGGLRFNYMPNTAPYTLREGMSIKMNGDVLIPGDVGIGMTNPVYKLDIAGNVNISGTGGYLRWNSGDMAIVNEGSYKLGFQTYNTTSSTLTTKMVLDTDGNVGIGTTTPSSKLEVYGSGSTVLDIQGSQGQLFSITDDLTGTLFAVSDISGVPIFNVNSSGLIEIDGDLNLGDSDKIQLGDSQDLQLYHDGSHSFIDGSNGAGSLYIRPGDGGTIQLETTTGSDMITAGSSTVTLYSGGGAKLATTSTGVEVTGVLKATSGGNIALGSVSNIARIQSDGNGGLKMLSSSDVLIGTFTTSKISGAELEGTELDINGDGDISGDLDIGTQTWKSYTNTAAKLNIEVNGGNAINIFNKQEDAAFLNFIDSQSDGAQYANLNFNSSGTNAFIINNMGYDTTISNTGNWDFPGDLTVSGGDITLVGTGRIQGVDTVSSGTDATNKNYVDSKFTSTDASQDDYTFKIDDEGNLSGNRWYHVATTSNTSGGLHIRGFISNHVEAFASQKLDLAIQAREGNNGGQLEITGNVDVLHNDSTTNGTDKVGIRVIKTAENGTYDEFKVYVRTCRYSMVTLRLSIDGAFTFNTVHTSPATSEPAPVTGGQVEIDTSHRNFFQEGNHLITNSEAIASFASIADGSVLFNNEDKLVLMTGGDNGTNLEINDANGQYLFTQGDVQVDEGSIGISADGSNHVILSENGTGDFKIDAPGDMTLDAGGGDIILKDDNTEFGLLANTTNNFVVMSRQNNKDLIFKGIDNATAFTALTLDMSEAGKATFNNDVIAFSDRKLKKDIKTLDGSKVYDMRGVSYVRKDTGNPGAGVVAQEIQKVAPELVNETNGTLGVSYGNITGYLIEAIKDLKAEIEELKKQIK